MANSMTMFQVERSTISLLWSYTNMPPALPMPGTAAFAALIKSLRPYGINASNIVTTRGGGNLGDIAITFGLVNREVTLRFTFSSFEVFATSATEEIVRQTIEIIELVFNALTLLDEETRNGRGKATINWHVKLLNNNATSLIKGYLIDKNSKHLKPEALSFKVEADQLSSLLDTRIVVMPSIQIEGGLFIEATYDFDSNKLREIEISLLSQFGEHLKLLFSLFDLQLAEAQ